MKEYKVSVVGASGLVGRTALKVLEERNFPISKLYLFASKKSAGKTIKFKNDDIEILELNENSFDRDIDVAIFCAGGTVSEKYAKIAQEKGVLVVDNSSCFRMDDEVPLIVPEVNKSQFKNHKGIIANPNCSTIQSVIPLKAIYDKFGVERVIYTTYQAVSGAGINGKNDLLDGIKGEPNKHFSEQIAFNVIPQIDIPLENGYYKEEMKMINETKKILRDDTIGVTATAVRVPVLNSHSVSINITTKKEFDIEDVKEILSNHEGIILVDDYKNNLYPTPIKASGRDEVFVGRVRRDESHKNSLNLFCVADNIRKGAATNAVQILELLLE